MTKLTLRIIVAVAVSMFLAMAGVSGNAIVLQTLFTVLGIVFSISMSLLVSFSLSKILNREIRTSLRLSIIYVRNMLLLDFGVSTFVLAVALMWNVEHLRYTFGDWGIIDIMLISVALVSTSLIYEIYNFRELHRLHTDIEDAVIAEEIGNVNH